MRMTLVLRLHLSLWRTAACSPVHQRTAPAGRAPLFYASEARHFAAARSSVQELTAASLLSLLLSHDRATGLEKLVVDG